MESAASKPSVEQHMPVEHDTSIAGKTVLNAASCQPHCCHWGRSRDRSSNLSPGTMGSRGSDSYGCMVRDGYGSLSHLNSGNVYPDKGDPLLSSPSLGCSARRAIALSAEQVSHVPMLIQAASAGRPSCRVRVSPVSFIVNQTWYADISSRHVTWHVQS